MTREALEHTIAKSGETAQLYAASTRRVNSSDPELIAPLWFIGKMLAVIALRLTEQGKPTA